MLNHDAVRAVLRDESASADKQRKDFFGIGLLRSQRCHGVQEKSNRTLIFADKTDTHGYKDRFIARGKMQRIRMLYFIKSLFYLQHFYV